MKRALLFTIIVSVFSFISCKKNYTCKCFKSISNQAPYAGFNIDSIKSTRKKADKHCADLADFKTSSGHDTMVCYANSYK